MLTQLKEDDFLVASAAIKDQTLDQLLSKEWLLTNSRGGYASGTVIGCNMRRYHGHLIGSLNPPVNRIMALPNCLETIASKDSAIQLSTFEFDRKIHPQGFTYQKAFRQDTGVHFDYQINKLDLELTKSIYLAPDSDTVALVYDFIKVGRIVDFTVSPFVALRNFHHLQKSDASLFSITSHNSLTISHENPQSPKLTITSDSMQYSQNPQWWYDFVYRIDSRRGQDFKEDLWTPGFFKASIDSPCKLVIWANLTDANSAPQKHYDNLQDLQKDLSKHQNKVITSVKTKDNLFKKLSIAADQFICKRTASGPASTQYTILAGFPWFADWGRDAFISLPGLLLCTKRYDVAKSVLTTFAHAVDKGMVPNRFDDIASTAHFNSIDASLWFINAAFEYLEASDDRRTFESELIGTICDIVQAYHDGTRFDTHADADALIIAGDVNTQLTWMDAKCHGIAFTPRYGKAVEINALWYNALCRLAQYYSDTDIDKAEHYHRMADSVQQSFIKTFWNPDTKCLNDHVLPNGRANSSIRPNQIFAVSLAFSPLPADMQKSVVEITAEKLLTPYGLRTLDPLDSNYQPRYEGNQFQRDQAYHQGTVWPFLIGHFIDAYLKVNKNSKKSKTQAKKFLQPLLQHFQSDSCLGSISEIFDAEHPQLPKGCFAQAWSVAELLRAYCRINNIGASNQKLK
ncbi:MAG: glycogen debranching enzyme family protein [Phycisphaerae bacterium]|nr:glycogen debranching enzyme family protein [Phycisphaerae bacterium]